MLEPVYLQCNDRLSGQLTQRDLWHASRRYSERGFPLLSRARSAVLLELSTGEFLHASWTGSTVFAAAKNALSLQQQYAAGRIAEDGNLHKDTQLTSADIASNGRAKSPNPDSKMTWCK